MLMTLGDRDHSGVLLSKRAFGREIYFQRPSHLSVPIHGQVFADNRGFERIEEELRHVIQNRESAIPFAL